MEVKDMVGMMSTGALLALGVMFVVDKLSGPGVAQPQMAAVQVQEPQMVQPEQPQLAPSEEVTRTDLNLLGQTTAAQIERIVAVSAQGLSQVRTLTPEQEEIIAFFRRTAREMNQQDRLASGGAVQFSNMAVRGLNVHYFYRVPAAFGTVDREALLEDQKATVRQTLCGNTAIRTLLSDYGFAYSYTYVSSDSRQLGQIEADARVCA